MSLFKRFTHKKDKSDAIAFKYKLKYGTDPKALYESARQHYETSREEDKAVKELLAIILEAPVCDDYMKWSSVEILDYGDDCEQSPIGKHVYMHTYGSHHPDYDKATHCLCCNKQLYRARNER